MSSFSPHAISRFFERTDLDVTRNQIMRAIEGGNIAYAKRLSAARSLAYILVGENVVKIIIGKGTKKVISVIPWKSVFKEMINIHSENKDYEVILFPDCFMETHCKSALTRVFRIHGDGAREPIPYNHPDFDHVFNVSWNNVSQDEKHLKIQKERQSGNEKIETQINRAQATA